jgi:hypothetical protein
MNRFASLALSLVTVSLAAGCGAGDGSAETSPASDGLVSVTAVRFNPDGTTTQVERRITREAEQAEYLALKGGATRETPMAVTNAPIAQDVACGTSDTWLYDGPNASGNRICFSGTGTADLTQFHDWSCSRTFCIESSWAGKVASYYPGGYMGHFTGRYPQSLYSSQVTFQAESGLRNVPTGFAADSLTSFYFQFPPPPPL